MARTLVKQVTGDTSNRLINSTFEFWQRNSSSTLNSTAMTADRFLLAVNGDGGTVATGTISKQTITGGTYFNSQSNYCRVTNTSQGTSLGVNSYHVLGQKIEDVRTFSNKSVTVSIWASSSIPNKQLGIYAIQVFGSGGSAEVYIPATVITLSSSVARYDVTLNFPTVDGKTIGSNSYVFISAAFQWGTADSAKFGISGGISWGGTGNIDIIRIQANEGSPVDFSTAGKTYAQELTLCQRYYEKSYNINVAPSSPISDGVFSFYPNAASSTWANNQASGPTIYYKVPKRTAANPTFWSENGSVGQCSNNRTTGFSIAPVFVSTQSFSILQNTGSAQTITNGWTCHWAVDAEF